jgi:hypothetical protein
LSAIRYATFAALMATSQSYTLRWTSWLLSYKELKIELAGF